MIRCTRVNDPRGKGEEFRDKGYGIVRLSNSARRWWLISCSELKELIVFSGRNSNVFGDSRWAITTIVVVVALLSLYDIQLQCDPNNYNSYNGYYGVDHPVLRFVHHDHGNGNQCLSCELMAWNRKWSTCLKEMISAVCIFRQKDIRSGDANDSSANCDWKNEYDQNKSPKILYTNILNHPYH